MCQNGERVYMGCLRPRINNVAVVRAVASEKFAMGEVQILRSSLKVC